MHTLPKIKIVFLDRDGVINEQLGDVKGRAPRNTEELKIFPDAITAIPKLASHGFEIIVVTNQPDIARRHNSQSNVNEVNLKIQESIPTISAVCVCPHQDQDNCYCRKPKAGLLIDQLIKMKADPQGCWMIGDRETDILAGIAAGTKTILINRSKEPTITTKQISNADFIVADLHQATKIILSIPN